MITPLMVSYPIRYQRRRVGVINVSDKHSGDPFNDQDLEFLSTLASQVAVAIENARLVKEMEDGYLGALVAIIQGVEDAAPGTRGHSRRVADLAAAIARVMDLQEARVDTLARAAMLHEIGRLAQPGRNGNGGGHADGDGDHGSGGSRDASGAGAGAAGAWDATAVMAAERILAPISSLRQVRETILHSTDAYEAAGGLFASEGAGVPVEARILAVCEEFVRRTPGDGRDAAAIAAALEAIRAGAGRRHDPEVVAALGFVVTGGRR
jgi:response regulator RpfG family c-di-GMP phosphodiesterase